MVSEYHGLLQELLLQSTSAAVLTGVGGGFLISAPNAHVRNPGHAGLTGSEALENA